MFYAAVILIFLGLFLLLYIFLSLSTSKSIRQPEEMRPVQNSEVLEKHIENKEKHIEKEEKSEQEISHLKKEIPVRKNGQELSTPGVMRFQWVDTADNSEKMIQKPVQEEIPIETFSTEGILFLDYGRKVHLNAGRFERIDPELFMKLKRSGRSDIVIRGTEFTIHTGNATHRYPSTELEQILFLDGGIALVPLDEKEPVSVFLTESVHEIRDHIKRNSGEAMRV